MYQHQIIQPRLDALFGHSVAKMTFQIKMEWCKHTLCYVLLVASLLVEEA